MSKMDTLIQMLADGHPVTGTYSINDAAAADEMNVLNIEQPKGLFSSVDVINLFVGSEYSGLDTSQKTQVWEVLHMAEIDLYGFQYDILRSMFGAASDTIAALEAARDGFISDAARNGLPPVKTGNVTSARDQS